MGKQRLVLIVVLLVSFALWGCDSNRGSNNSASISAVSVADAERTGNCLVCHTLDVHLAMSAIAGQNTDTVNGYGSEITHDCEDCHGGGQYHNGDGPIPYPAPDGERCATCHIQATQVLESKHNAGEPTNTAMIAAGHDDKYCQRCHTAEGSIVFREVVGDKTTITSTIIPYNVAVTPVGNQQMALPHLLDMTMAYNSAYKDVLENHTLHNPTCVACHNPLTMELVTFDPAVWDPNANGVSDQFDLCTSCHNYYLNDGTLFGSGSVNSGTAEFFHNNSWYRNITTTHYDDHTTGFMDDGDGDGVPDRNVAIEGYVMREDSANPCYDCHGHELHTNTRYANDLDGSSADKMPTPYNSWAKSAHAGGLLNNVIAAVNSVTCDPADPSLSRGKCNDMTDAAMDAYVSDATGAAWSHYDWDKSQDTVPGDRTGRAACQMCHTATGAANFLDNPEGYSPANNDYSHLADWSAATGSPQNEMLYCWGCHSNAAEGVLRTPGAITLAYSVDGVKPTLPDLGNSNVCINCHSGRGNMDSLLKGAVADPAGAAVTGGTKTHYLAAGATIFQAQTRVGYEYVGQDYADKRYYGHVRLGCAECHMDSTEAHTLNVVEKDVAGVIVGIKADICVTCHNGKHALFVSQSLVGSTADIWDGAAAVPTVVTQLMADDAAAEVEHESHGYHDALEALAAELVTAGTTPTASYPYFVRTDGQDVLDPPTATLAEAVTDQGHGGAMHNYSYLHHEPGAYAHNRYYAKRLIFDSIDWLDGDNYNTTVTPAVPGADGNNLDGNIILDIVDDAAAIEWFGGDAVTGDAERP